MRMPCEACHLVSRAPDALQSFPGVGRHQCVPVTQGTLTTQRRHMSLTLVIRIALRALARHTLRSVLSMLGISIGVGAFICSVAVGQGAARQIEEQIRSLG